MSAPGAVRYGASPAPVGMSSTVRPGVVTGLVDPDALLRPAHSPGMAALFGDPPVIMLDEPFNGIGPGGIARMRDRLMGEAQDTSDRIAAASEHRATLRTAADVCPRCTREAVDFHAATPARARR